MLEASLKPSRVLSSIYSSAFLFEREGRLDDAIEAWRYIIDWCESRGYELDTEWPKRELERLREAASPAPEPPVET